MHRLSQKKYVGRYYLNAFKDLCLLSIVVEEMAFVFSFRS